MSTAAPTTEPVTTSAPTTSAPTTLAPTTLGPTTVAPTTIPATTLIPTTPWPGWTIDAGPIEVEIVLVCWFHYYPPSGRDATLDQWYSADSIEVELEITGEPLNQWIEAGSIDVELEIVHDDFVIGLVFDDCTLEVEITIESYGMVIGTSRTNWVKWSKIGVLDFTIDESNIAGERPLDWRGYVYCVKKLADKIIAYGQNGVTVLKAVGINYGMETIYRIGVMGKGAVTGTEFEHYFIDTLGQMWKLGDKLVKLDYSEYLSHMSNPIMSLDINKNLIYICDGVRGYVYSTKDQSFGEGPVNISGVGSRTSNMYVAAPGPIVTPKFEICTDIYDFGTRKDKTVYSIEVGTDLTENLHASVDYKTSYKHEFVQIGWFLVNPDGFAFPKCFGVEFRFRLRSFLYEYFEIDYLKIGGMIHDFSYLDTTARESQRIAAGAV